MKVVLPLFLLGMVLSQDDFFDDDAPETELPDRDYEIPQEEVEVLDIEAQIEYYMSGTRGFWNGYMEGLYKQKDPYLDDACLDEGMSMQLARIIHSTKGFRVPSLF